MEDKMNKIFLAGKLTRDPDIAKSQYGETIVNLFVSSVKSYRTPKGDNKVISSIIPVSVFGKVADIFVKAKLEKEDFVTVFGELREERWLDNNGDKRVMLRVFADKVFKAEKRESNE